MSSLNDLDLKIKKEIETKVLEVANQAIDAAELGTYSPEELVNYCRKVANDIAELTGINKGGVYVL